MWSKVVINECVEPFCQSKQPESCSDSLENCLKQIEFFDLCYFVLHVCSLIDHSDRWNRKLIKYLLEFELISLENLCFLCSGVHTRAWAIWCHMGAMVHWSLDRPWLCGILQTRSGTSQLTKFTVCGAQLLKGGRWIDRASRFCDIHFSMSDVSRACEHPNFGVHF